MDIIGTCSFELPMALRANYALDIGTMARITDTTRGNQGTFIVSDKSESISADGHWSNFTLFDLMEELRWGEIPGFVAQDKLFETTATTALRLIEIANLAQPAHPWQVVFTGPDYFAGQPFQCEGLTPFRALDKLRHDRYLHMRRNPLVGNGYERTLEIGTVATTPSGIRLVKPSARSGDMNRDDIRPIPEGGLSPKADAASIINCIVPTGSGPGWAQLTLKPLWNPVHAVFRDGYTGYEYVVIDPFVGLNPAYNLLYRRIRYDGGGLDGYEYFLVNEASVLKYRQRWLRYPRTDIGSVSSATLDEVAAAQNLYLTAVAYLQSHATPNRVLGVQTIGRGVVTGLAAQTVEVDYPYTENGTDRLGISGPYYVLGVERSISDADSTMTDVWNVSSLGHYAQTNATVQAGISQAIDTLRLGGTIYPSRAGGTIDSPIDANNPVTVTVDVDPGVISVVQCIFTVALLPLISPVNGGTIVPHTHSTLIPAVAIDASVPYTNESGYNPSGQAAYGHADNLTANRSGAYGENISANRSGAYGENISANRSGAYGENITANRSGAYGENITANRSGAYGENIGVDDRITVGDNIGYGTTNLAHVHYVQMGSNGGSPVNQTVHFIAQGDNSFLEVQGGSGGSFHTNGYYGSGGGQGDPNHAHTKSGSVSKSGNASRGGAASKSGGLKDTLGVYKDGGLKDGLGVYKDGGLKDGLGVYKDGGLKDGLGVYKDGGLQDGLGVYRAGATYAHAGFQPNTNFPGYSNYRTQAQTVQTSGPQSASNVMPQYGIYQDPHGQPSNVYARINGAVVAGPYNAAFTVDLTAAVAAQVSGGVPVDVVFTSATLGRIIARHKVRYRESVYRIG